MNLTEWRTAVKEQAGRLRSRLNNLVRHTEQLAPGVLYGATATLAVAPAENAASYFSYCLHCQFSQSGYQNAVACAILLPRSAASPGKRLFPA